uniref:1-phosphatidylinositol 4-kinase n=1 Tax=Picocystis salinarum TaxID=88271 RepID=A0A7S3XGP1_9CHLO|mmetsp:Transcript_2216/g.14711  ORF Transcript_2216/g.14711 Transcript_2216/m.14711 type:complete len:610 (+) Transcript_2216:520-2349(+)|eukprot:CAMPEP_0183830360 /NCGR_PEP_ID=MMETSP0807_2-20130328/3972_1 /TAXON_ID=88271 /ORGANISM="Picocystis salinarum, Strain CCMP1897" /LENGTH=609 /DNA_ID=CAMNT_0026075719 /DNA_START=486 /DNA_END=2315 /DNA_ORIENTATION=-
MSTTTTKSLLTRKLVTRTDVVSPVAPPPPPRESEDDISLYMTCSNAAGDVRTVRVLEHEPIVDLSFGIHTHQGVVRSGKKLTFGNPELKKNCEVAHMSTVAESLGGDVMHMAVQLKDLLYVRVRTVEHETEVAIRRNQSVRDLKEVVQREEGIEAEDMQLLLRGRELDDESAISETALSDGTILHLLVRNRARVRVQSATGKKLELTISSSESIESLKEKLDKDHGIDVSSHRLMYKGRELQDGRTLASYGISRIGNLSLEVLNPQKKDGCDSTEGEVHLLSQSIEAAKRGLLHGFYPELASSGSGGAYMMYDDGGSPVAVFKPEDEEPLAANNPRPLTYIPTVPGEGLRRGTKVGEGAKREVAAFLLDKNHFSSVPATTLVKFGDGKVGSLQQFVLSESDCENMGPSLFSVKEVHKICLLDIRLANTDRNGGNILVKESPNGYDLIPIDHGYCLPSSFMDCSFEWAYWPQAKVPFDAATCTYINSIDVEEDLTLLKQNGVGLRPECERVYRISVSLLQKASKALLSPHEISKVMCRDTPTSQSPLEKLVSDAYVLAAAENGVRVKKSASLPGILEGCSETEYLNKVEELLDSYLLETSSDDLQFACQD